MTVVATRHPPDAANRPRRRDVGRAGFGLIEAIVALAIAGLVLAAVTELAGRTLRSWNRGFGTVAAVERTDIAIGRIATDLGTLLPVSLATADDPAILFAGDEQSMAFTALTPFDRTVDGIGIVEIAVERGADGAVLARRMRRGRDAGLRDGDRVVLLSGRLDLAFAYRDQAGRRVARWSRPGEVPRGVIVTLRGQRDDGGLPVEVMLPIPVAISVSCLPEASGAVEQGGNTTGEEMIVPEDPKGTAPVVDGAPKPAPGDDRGRRCATGPGKSATATRTPEGGERPPSPGGER